LDTFEKNYRETRRHAQPFSGLGSEKVIHVRLNQPEVPKFLYS